ncbi:MAG: oligosaccharide flippase family protein [Proteobacteria bacterium]|nr:oligosaccharide flippase family protein [Pseudomonadota bacterium]
MASSPDTNQSVQSVARGAGINMLGEIIGAAGAPLLYLVISWVLGPKILGTYILVTYYIALFLRLAVLGFDKGALRHIPIARATTQSERAQASVLGTSLRWTATLSLIITALIGLFPGIFLKVGGDENALAVTWWMAVLVLALPGQALTKVILYAIRGLSNMWAFVLVQNVVAPLTLMGLSLLPLLLGFDERSLAIGFVSSAYLSLIVALFLLVRLFPNQTAGAVIRSKRDSALIAFSYPQGFTEALNYLLGRVDIIMIGAFFPDKPEWVAFYGMAALIAGVVKKVRFSFDNSFSPVFAELVIRGDYRGMAEQYRTVGRWIFTLFVLFAGTLTLSSKFVLSIYGSDFTDYWIVVPILVFGRMFNAAGGPAQAALLMAGRSKLEFANNIMINIVNVLLNLILIPRYHVFGAAIATTVSLTVFNLARLVEVAALLKIWVNPMETVRIAAAGLITGVPAIAILLIFTPTPGTSLLAGVVFLVLYPGCLFLIGDKADVKSAWAMITNRLLKRSKTP